MKYILLIYLLILCIPLVLFMIFKPHTDDRKNTDNIINYDTLMQHHCFALNCTRPEAIDRLLWHNTTDTLDYSFDPRSSTLIFSHLGTSIEFQLSFYLFGNRTYLKVSRVKYIHNRSNILYMINQFFIDKLDAVPVDYTYFEAAICSR